MPRRPPPPFPLSPVLAAILCAFAAGLACGGDGHGPSPTPTSILLSPAGPLNLPSGSSGQFVATVLDQRGAPIPGAVVTWASSAPAVVSVTSAGVYSAGLVGTAEVTAAAGTVVSAPVQVTVVAGPAGAGVAVAGGNQVGKVVASPADTMVLLVTDLAGNPVAGHSVSWQIPTGAGTLAFTTTLTDAAGLARNVLTLGTQAGLTVVRAVILVSPAVSVDFQVMAVGGAPAALGVANHLVVGDSGTTVAPSWGAVDQYGNPTTVPAAALVSRAPGVVAVDAAGNLALLARGQGVVVATIAGGLIDSLLVAAAEPAGPVLRADLTSFGVTAGSQVTMTVVLDMRASAELLGAATVQVSWNPALLTYLSDADPGSGVNATVNTTNAAIGSLTLAMASGAGLSGAVGLRAVTFQVAASPGVTGPFTLGTTEVTAALTFRNLLGRTVALSHPLVSR